MPGELSCGHQCGPSMANSLGEGCWKESCSWVQSHASIRAESKSASRLQGYIVISQWLTRVTRLTQEKATAYWTANGDSCIRTGYSKPSTSSQNGMNSHLSQELISTECRQAATGACHAISLEANCLSLGFWHCDVSTCLLST